MSRTSQKRSTDLTRRAPHVAAVVDAEGDGDDRRSGAGRAARTARPCGLPSRGGGSRPTDRRRGSCPWSRRGSAWSGGALVVNSSAAEILGAFELVGRRQVSKQTNVSGETIGAAGADLRDQVRVRDRVLAPVAQLALAQREITERVGMIGIESSTRRKSADGGLEPTELAKDHAAVPQRIDMIWRRRRAPCRSSRSPDRDDRAAAASPPAGRGR